MRGTPPNMQRFHQAWALVSKNPQITRRELQAALGLKSSSGATIYLRKLAAAGLIELIPLQTRGIKVLIPLALVRGAQ